MTVQFFKGLSQVTEIKALYKKLAMQHHPDRGGDTRMMQELNAQYHKALESCHGEVYTGTDKVEHTYWYSSEKEELLVKKIDEIIRSGVLNNDQAECLLIGTWIWIIGDTKPIKEQLKAMKMSWHSKRLAWYWHTPQFKRKYNPNASLDDLALAYGAARIVGSDHEESYHSAPLAKA
jgi:hypothetical protein